MLSNPDFMLPISFIHGDLGVEKWKNIPHPVVNATEVFERCFGNVSRILKDLITENKRKSEMIVTKFKKLDTKISTHEEQSKRITDILANNIREKLAEFQAMLTEKLSTQ